MGQLIVKIEVVKNRKSSVVGPAVDVADDLRHQLALLSSPSDEKVVRQLPASWSRLRPGGIIPRRQVEKGVGQEEAVFWAGSQEKEAVVVAAADSMRTQHSPS
nr:unnamed protein product [Spirometra erinaceieuropaei]